jgi:anhydro-N-acetylmuramic acid kinase
LHAVTGIPVICDFRLQDVLLGGQGAPLVPIGDEYLFSNYGACLNLGGFANISMSVNDERLAWDICPVNIVLNYLCQRLNIAFDKGGEMARMGALLPRLLERLNTLPFYQFNPPKSLGREWVEQHIFPLLTGYKTEDLLHTYTVHAAFQIGRSLEYVDQKTALITGGGAFNAFLVEQICMNTKAEIVVSKPEIINYKEALIFAFLGVLRLRNQPNCLASVTGAISNHSSGRIYNRGLLLK